MGTENAPPSTTSTARHDKRRERPKGLNMTQSIYLCTSSHRLLPITRVVDLIAVWK